jgi:predicted metal-dependent HD superfamily phosphohydrolase
MPEPPDMIPAQHTTCVMVEADLHKLGGEKARYVQRVLDVRQGELCWVVGTVYMEMNLKPNVLDDISKEVRILFKRLRRRRSNFCHSIGYPLHHPAKPT